MNRATVYVKELDMFLTMEVLEHTPAVFYRSESFAMKTGIPTNGSMVKNHISLKTVFGYSAAIFSQEAYGVLLFLFFNRVCGSDQVG